MLVLTRKVGEGIKIGDDVVIRVIQVKGKQVRIGVQAPKETKVQRDELEKEPSKLSDTVTKSSQESSAPSTKNEL